MLNNGTVKTKSGLKSLLRVLLACLVLVLIAILSLLLPHETKNILTVTKPDGQIAAYTLKRVTSDADKEKGLSGTARLGAKDGMLFWNNSESTQCFWMKDMHYSLDIIWVNAQKKVTHIEKELAPQTYPQSYCHTGQYIIELQAGQADESGIKAGQILTF